MGFSIYYRSTRPVSPALAGAVVRAALEMCRGRSWLGCEPVTFFPEMQDGHLMGGSKPNFLPHPRDHASAALSGLPDGTTRDLLDILCRLSREHRIDWELSHDHSGGPVGYIRSGVCDDEVTDQMNALACLGEFLEGLTDDESQFDDFPPPAPCGNDEDEDDRPYILPFRPRQ